MNCSISKPIRKVALALCIAMLACMTSMAQYAPMSALDVEQFKRSVTQTSQQIKTLHNNFTQYKHMDFLANDIVSSGTMTFRAPNTVKWAYNEPFQYSVIFIDGKMKINDDGKKSEVNISNHKLLSKLNDMMIKSVRGDLFSDPDFSVEFFGGAANDKMVMTPKDKRIAEHIATFELLFGKGDRVMLELKMIEPNDDFTRIEFNDRQLNPAIGDAVFAH